MNIIFNKLVKNQNFIDSLAVIRGLSLVLAAKKQSTFQYQTVEIQPNQNTKQQDIYQIDHIVSKQQKQTQNDSLKENYVPSGQVSRVFEFSKLGISLASNVVKTYVSKTISGESTKDLIKDALTSQSSADALANALCKMRGAPLKLAQALSIQEDDLIPKPIKDAFEKARQSADMMPEKQVKQMLDQWVSEYQFKKINFIPFAAASIGQVHYGESLDGKQLAIKIQYPGIKESIDSDMQNVLNLMKYTKIFPKTLFVDKLILNTKKELYEECNYIIEGEKQERFRKLIDNRYIVPEIILAKERVLISQYLPGDSIDYIADNYPQELRNYIGSLIMDLTLTELFKFRFMQTDPNPANFAWDRDRKQLILLDFGAAREYDSLFLKYYKEIIHGAVVNDQQKILDQSIKIGFLTGEENEIMKQTHIKAIQTVGEPFAQKGNFDFGNQDMTKRIYKMMPIMLKNRLKGPPPEVYSLHRKLSGAFLMNMRLKSKVDCHSIFAKLY